MKSGKEKIKQIALNHCVKAAGFVAVNDIEEYERFVKLTTILPAELGYLQRGETRKNVSLWFSKAKTCLICAFPYWDNSRNFNEEIINAAKSNKNGLSGYLSETGRKIFQRELLNKKDVNIARYVLNEDYHITVKNHLKAILNDVKNIFPSTEGKIFCDTSPVMEKELARLAGIGFRGKNSLIVSKELGSYFVIGGIALNLEIPPDKPIEDNCGNCDLCSRACPSKALKNGVLSAEKCLSYWTTQAKLNIPKELYKCASFAYGCDICQQACPYNNK